MADEFADIAQHDQFLALVREGTPHELAAIEVGWSTAKLRRALEDDDFRTLILEAEEMKDATIEHVLFNAAKVGREWAVKLWLFNRRGDKWRDVRHIDVSTTIQLPPDVIAATKALVAAQVSAAIGQGQSLAALQASLLGDDDDIVDAEVIGDDQE